MNNEQFKERFAVDDQIGGSDAWLLTSHGCFQRHNLTRNEQMNTIAENRTKDMSYVNRAEREERMLVNRVHTLISKGHKIQRDETFESFIARVTDTEEV